MANKGVFLGLVIALSVFIGVTWVVQQTNNPLMQRVLVQQGEMIALQKKLLKELVVTKPPVEEKAAKAGGQAPKPLTEEDTRTLAQKVSDIDERLMVVTEVFKSMKAGMGQRRQAAAPPPEDLNKVYDLPLAHSPVNGPADAPVTIVSFLDFQCPYSAKFQPVVHEVQKALPDQVRFVVKHFPLGFHPQAKPAAKAVLAAGEQGKYWELYEKVLKNARTLSQEKYEEWAEEIGMNVEQFKKDLKDKDAEYEKIVAADMALATKSAVRGTPTIFLNGKKTRSRTVEAFKAEIDSLLKEKK